MRRSASRATEPTEHPRVIVFQALALSHWSQSIAVIHEEYLGRNFIRLNLDSSAKFDGEGWTSLEFDSRESANQQMLELRGNLKSIFTLFSGAGVAEIPKWIRGWQHEWGFSDFLVGVDANRILRIARGDDALPESANMDILSLGNNLSAILDDESYFPASTQEVNLFWEFLSTTPLDIGFFGNFKFVLKRLTSQFDFMVEKSDQETARSLAATIGAGYGRIEGYLSKGNLTPIGYLTGESGFLRGLRQLPEFGGKAYVSTATAQYLARKGLRFMRHLESRFDDLTVLKFKVNLLYMADFSDQRSVRFQDRQIIVNDIVFGKSGLAPRHKSSRKSNFAIEIELDARALPFEPTTTIPRDEVEVWTTFLANLAGKNETILRYAFEVSEALGVGFNWTDSAIRVLGRSTSEKIQDAILRVISGNLSKFFVLDSVTQLRFLRLLPETELESLFSEMGKTSGNLANSWVLDRSEGELDERDILISKLFLTHQRGQIYRLFLLDFLVNLARYSQFQPVSDWGPIVGLTQQNVYWMSTEEFANFLGAGDSDGVLTVLKSPESQILDVFASDASVLFKWRSQEEISLLLNSLLDSGVPALKRLASKLIRRKLLPENLVVSYLASRSDPNLALVNLSESIAEQDPDSFLAQLVALGEEKSRVFWRLHAKEVEKLLRNWSEFPKFFWSNLKQIPKYVRETVGNYEWLATSLRSHITATSVAKLDEVQAEVFAQLLTRDNQMLASDSMLRAVLIAPNARINEIGAAHVKVTNRYSDFWLLMLESNLPVTSQAGFEYLKSQSKSESFADLLVMALDSNNRRARDFAKSALLEASNPRVLSAVVEKLAENRNPDTWELVTKNLQTLLDKDAIQVFTRRVFLSRRQARSAKENIKRQVESVVSSISDAVEKEILLRMSFSSVSKDREWALRQLASGNIHLDEVVVEKSWSGPRNV